MSVVSKTLDDILDDFGHEAVEPGALRHATKSVAKLQVGIMVNEILSAAFRDNDGTMMSVTVKFQELLSEQTGHKNAEH